MLKDVDRIRLLIRERWNDDLWPSHAERSIKALLKKRPEVDIVGEVTEHVELLVAVRNTNADAVLLLIDTDEDEGMLSHLFAEYPDLTVLTMPVNPLGYSADNNAESIHRSVVIEQRCRYRYRVDSLTPDAAVQALCSAIQEPLELINMSSRRH